MSGMQAFYPVLQTDRLAESRAFYTELLGFEIAFDSDWYVSLRLGDFQLALMETGHESVPAAGRGRTTALILNLEVDNARAEHERLIEKAGLAVELPLRDEPWGQRHFITRDPNGVLLDVIEPIPPSPEFAAQYAADEPPSL